MDTFQLSKQKTLNHLKKNGVLNSRIAQKIRLFKNLSILEKYQKRLINEKKLILKVYYSALAKGIELSHDPNCLIQNLDSFDSKSLTKEIADIQYFKKRKAECIRKLSNVEIPPRVIELLLESKNIQAIKNILDKLPPKLLIDTKVMKTKYGNDYLTKASVKAISTPMKS